MAKKDVLPIGIWVRFSIKILERRHLGGSGTKAFSPLRAMPIGALHSHVSARLQLVLVFQVSFWKSELKMMLFFLTCIFLHFD
jgi:hypothetical protein